MTITRKTIGLATVLIVALIVAVTVVARPLWHPVEKTTLVAYFDNTNGLFAGDEVRILGVPVGKIDTIEPQPQRAKVILSVDAKYKIPADAKAAILSPSLVTARAIQLTPAYTGGPVMATDAVIPQSRTAVPVEWDDLRQQLQRLSTTLQPTGPGDTSTLGEFINTAAANLRGQGANIRETIIQLSQVFSALGDHSNDIFSTLKNLSILVSALHSSTELMSNLNTNLAAVTALLANDPDEVAQAVRDISAAAADVQQFAADNRETVGTTSDKLASISQALTDSLEDIQQTLHVAPTAFANFINIYEPAHGSVTGALAFNNFANPIGFLCGAIQAASRMGAEQAAKLCVQYLAPIIKNRQYNFLPFGLNLFRNAQARPNEVTYSEDWMRPDYIPPQPPAAAAPVPAGEPTLLPTSDTPPLAAEATVATNPAEGLPGLMVPHGSGS